MTTGERTRVYKTLVDDGRIDLLNIGQLFCQGCNLNEIGESEYVRGQAELICDITRGLGMDDRPIMADLLINPTKPLFQVEFKATGDG
jgi:hypothetical protein